jgi:hypothetical protein
MPLTAAPMTSEATAVAPMPRTQVPIQSAAVPAMIAIATDAMSSGPLYDIESGMTSAAMPR